MCGKVCTDTAPFSSTIKGMHEWNPICDNVNTYCIYIDINMILHDLYPHYAKLCKKM